MKIKEELLYLVGKVKFFYSLSLTIKNDNTSLDGVLLKEQHGEFDIVQEFDNISLENIIDKFKSYPVILSVLGEGILTKVVENKTGFLKKIFFNSDPDDFYICDRGYKSYRLVSFCRRETLDSLIIKLADFKIIYISLGISDLLSIESFVTTQIISYKGHRLDLSNSELSYTQTLNENIVYEIDGVKFPSYTVLPMAGYISYKKGVGTLIGKEVLTSGNSDEVKFGRIFSLVMPIVVFFMLTLTVSGHFIKNTLLEEKVLRQGELESYQRNENLLNNLKADLKKKHLIYSQSGFNNKFYVVKIISTIGNSVPGTIRLDGINFQPVLNTVREDKIIELEPGILRISGRSDNHESFQEWVKELELFSETNKIEIEDYARENNGVDKFIILIELI